MAGRKTLAALLTVPALLVAACSPSTASGSGGNSSSMKFVNVIKLTSSTWFTRMNTGIDKFTKETGVNATQTGPAQATAEGQVSIITSLIPQNPTVIGVDPNDQQAVEGVLGQAQKQGIIVVSQEASQLQHTNFDLEAFSNQDYGVSMMDALSTCMGGKGQYAAFVGNLTAQSHMQWVSAALAEAKAKYPGITRVTSPIATDEDANVAYQKTKELLAKYPHIRGFEGSAATDVIGIAKAVQEAGLSGKVCIVGTSIPSLAGNYVENGTIYKIFLWDPALAGEATMQAALMLAHHEKITAGTNLKVPGYTDIQPCGQGATAQCFRGNAELVIDKSNISKYKF